MEELDDRPLSYFCSICHSRFEDDPDIEFIHEQCKNIIDMDEDTIISTTVHLAYYKQGDDLNRSLINSEGDIVSAFENLAADFEDVIKHLRIIASELKNANFKDLSLYADTHHIGLTGPKKFLYPLVEKKIANYEPYFDE